MEGNALADFENPLLGAIGWLEAFSHVGLGSVLAINLHERGTHDGLAEGEGEAVGPGCGEEGKGEGGAPVSDYADGDG